MNTPFTPVRLAWEKTRTWMLKIIGGILAGGLLASIKGLSEEWQVFLFFLVALPGGIFLFLWFHYATRDITRPKNN